MAYANTPRAQRPNPITFITDGTIAARVWMLLAIVGFAGWAIIPQMTIQVAQAAADGRHC